MDSKEKRKQYYIENRDKIIERNKKYYYDNREERLKYNHEYWAINGHKYVEKRMKDPDYVSKYTEYNKIYRERSKHMHQDNFFHATSMKDFIVTFD